MSLARRHALLDWARRRQAAIVEDDYDSEFRFSARPLEPLYSLDTAGRVLYAGRSPRPCCRRVRTGFVLAPPVAARRRCVAARQLSDGHGQVAVAGGAGPVHRRGAAGPARAAGRQGVRRPARPDRRGAARRRARAGACCRPRPGCTSPPCSATDAARAGRVVAAAAAPAWSASTTCGDYSATADRCRAASCSGSARSTAAAVDLRRGGLRSCFAGAAPLGAALHPDRPVSGAAWLRSADAEAARYGRRRAGRARLSRAGAPISQSRPTARRTTRRIRTAAGSSRSAAAVPEHVDQREAAGDQQHHGVQVDRQEHRARGRRR